MYVWESKSVCVGVWQRVCVSDRKSMCVWLYEKEGLKRGWKVFLNKLCIFYFQMCFISSVLNGICVIKKAHGFNCNIMHSTICLRSSHNLASETISAFGIQYFLSLSISNPQKLLACLVIIGMSYAVGKPRGCKACRPSGATVQSPSAQGDAPRASGSSLCGHLPQPHPAKPTGLGECTFFLPQPHPVRPRGLGECPFLLP